MPTFTSKDGTSIAYDVRGSGPAVILIDGAWCGRNMGPMPKLAPLLAPHFTVYNYDRRAPVATAASPPIIRPTAETGVWPR